MLATSVQKHPRYTVAVVVGLLVALLMLTGQHASTSPPAFSSIGSTYSQGASLAKKLQDAESEYNVFLKRRQLYIKKLGPDPANVSPFPHDKLYTLWDFFLPAFNCPHSTKRVGTLGDGGKYVCGLERIVAKTPPCVIYSFGLNGESSFEADLLQSTKCELWGYDFSVKEFGPEIEGIRDLKHRSHFFAYGLSGKDNHGSGASPPMWTLPSLMEKNNHTFIDILKIDIEGAEFDAISELLQAYQGRPLPFGQLQLEIHAQTKTFDEFLKWWEALETAGLRPFWTEPNLVYVNLYRSRPDLAEYSFINIQGNHALISDAPGL